MKEISVRGSSSHLLIHLPPIAVNVLSIAATILIAYLHWQERDNHPLLIYGLSLILGGAFGNLVDRGLALFNLYGYNGVVDFIDICLFVDSYRWYIFNIADLSVSIGMILYIYYSYVTINRYRHDYIYCCRTFAFV